MAELASSSEAASTQFASTVAEAAEVLGAEGMAKALTIEAAGITESV